MSFLEEALMSFSLLMLNGPTPGAKIPLNHGRDPVSIGRHVSRDLNVDDDRASRLHAQITYRADRWHVEDCGSLNGTFVNSQPIQQSVLEAGDLIRVADALILFVDDATDHAILGMGPAVQPSETIHDPSAVPNPQGGLVEKSIGDSMSRIARDSAVLCRLANLLQQHNDTDVLFQVAIDALVEGIDPDSVSIWLVAADGRLRCAASWGQMNEGHLLASLAVEKEKAILIEGKHNEEETVTDAPSVAGRALGVPIPGPRMIRGAIECHRSPKRGVFSHPDLDFAVVVAHQAGSVLENLEHRERLEQANEELRRRLSKNNKLFGASAEMKSVLDQIARVGPSASTVLVLGESGTGKELVAQSIHECSPQSAGPYVTVNCAAFSESLLESELFGHEVGSFTGADRRHIGQFERAHRGTIFLDEVGEMSLACQSKLLRILEGHPFLRLGGSESIMVEVRVIAATHRDLQEMVKNSTFREDLYYRLRVIDILVPPLRKRGDDALELSMMFLDTFYKRMGRGPTRLSKAAIDSIRTYHWPGNVRELKNAVERAVVLGVGDEVVTADLGLSGSSSGESPQGGLISLRDAELRHIRHVLQLVNGNKTEACKILGIGRGTLYKKLEEIEASD
jgi:DNA-binding NtrC family response regulator